MRQPDWKHPLTIAVGIIAATPGALWMAWIYLAQAWPSFFPLILMLPGLAVTAFGILWLIGGFIGAIMLHALIRWIIDGDSYREPPRDD